MEKVRIIKRYQNRKLYDTQQSCYVTLDEIAQIIREGHEIKVVENKSGRDITYTNQIQLLFDQEKKSNGPLNTSLLQRVIRSGDGIFSGYVKELERKLSIGHHESEEIAPIIQPIVQEQVQKPEIQDYIQRLNSTIIETPSSIN